VVVTVLTGVGRGFSAGANMKDPNTHALDAVADGMKRQPTRFNYLWDYRKVLIGAINGYAYGAGMNMVLSCDIIIASTAARFSLPASKLGIVHNGPAGNALALFVGKAKASEMYIMSRAIDGEDAYHWGLANKVVPPDQLLPEAMAWAEEIAALAPLSLRLIKEDLKESFDHHFNYGANRLRATMSHMTEDREEGHRAVREKRAPIFKGR